MEKGAKKKYEFTGATIGMTAGAAVLAVLSLLIFYFAFANWRFKSALTEGYRASDQNLMGQAGPALRDALSWRPEHRGARERLAKIAVDGGALDEAQKHYLELRKAGHNAAQVRVGLGVILLKRAERAEDPKAAADFVAQATAEFKSAAGSIPEADLGLGHAELLLAWKLKEPQRIDAARGSFERVKKALDARTPISRDGLIDYYAGLGKVLGSAPGWDPAAAAAYRTCAQLSRRWLAPQAAILTLEARRFDEWKEGGDALLKLRAEATKTRNEASNLFRTSSDARAVLFDPWLAYSLSLARAFGRNGLVVEHQNIVNELTRESGQLGSRVEPFLVDARVHLDVAFGEHASMSSQDAAVTRAVTAAMNLERKLQGTDDAGKDRKARALNLLGCLKGWKGMYSNHKGTLGEATKAFQDAAKLFPEDYVYNRNAALLLKRSGAAAAAILPHKDAAKAAAKGDYEKDWDQVSALLGP